MYDEHFNKNLPCSIAIKATSDDPMEAELLEVSLVPLRLNFTPSVTRLPLTLYIRPECDNVTLERDEYRRARYDYPSYMLARQKDVDACKDMGMDADDAITTFENWFSGLGLGRNKKIIPMAYGWGYLQSFMIYWMGYRNYEDRFDWHYRDPFSLVSFDMDQRAHRKQDCPWRKVDLTSVVRSANLPDEQLLVGQLDTMSIAVKQAYLYRKFLDML